MVTVSGEGGMLAYNGLALITEKLQAQRLEEAATTVSTSSTHSSTGGNNFLGGGLSGGPAGGCCSSQANKLPVSQTH